MTSKAEFQRGIMDAVTSPDIETVVVMASSQVGKTEILLNIIGYYIHQDPSPILKIDPTLEMAQTFSKDRFAPMIRDTPVLNELMGESKSRNGENTILHKRFPGGHITMAGANSPASLASRPIKIVLLDETDRFPASAGIEGDPAKLATKRTQTFWNRKIIMASTPTIKGVSRIEFAYENSDQRKYFVPCPMCGEKQVLLFQNLQFDKENLSYAYYQCQKCNAKLGEREKHGMVQRGEWIAAKNMRSTAGFHISELYSQFSTWLSIAQNFLEAKKRVETLKVWVNTTLGETWEEHDENQIEEGNLLARVENYTNAPEGVIMVTAGIDVQDDRLHLLTIGWGMDQESWILGYEVFPGDPIKLTVYEDLERRLNQPVITEDGRELKILASAIDTGGHRADSTYHFVKPRTHKRIYPIKGMGGWGRVLISRASTNNKFKVPVFPIGVDTGKEIIYSRLQQEDFGPGYIHFNHRVCDETFLKELTAERQITEFKKGFPRKVWIKKRERNEALDCFVYALAAYHILNPDMTALKRHQEEELKKKNDQQPQQKVIKKKARRGGFVNGW